MNPLDGRILVTGGAGFIGSALVWALNRRGHRDIVLTDFLAPAKQWQGVVPLSTSREEKRRPAMTRPWSAGWSGESGSRGAVDSMAASGGAGWAEGRYLAATGRATLPDAAPRAGET